MPRLYPSQPVVGVGGLVLSGERILLVRRAAPPARGLWSIPGGHLELGETILEAAARETLEETGIEADPLGVVNVDDAIRRDERGVRYHYVLITVLLKPRDPAREPRPGGDALDARYYTLGEALQLNLTPSTRGLIAKITQGRLPLDSPIPVNRYEPPD